MSYEFTLADEDNLTTTGGLPTAFPLSFCAWVKVPSFWPPQGHMVGCDDTGNIYGSKCTVGNDYGSGDKFTAGVSNALGDSRVVVSTAATIATNTWAHVAVVLASSTSRKIYVAGALTTGADTTSITPTWSALDHWALGARPGVSAFGGKLAEFAAWSAELTQDDVDNLAAGVRPSSVQAASLLSYLPMLSDLTDEKGLTWTNDGAVQDNDHPTMNDGESGSTFVPRITRGVFLGILGGVGNNPT